MTEKEDKIVNIKVKTDGKIYHAKTGNLPLVYGDEIIFEQDQFQDVGVIVECCVAKESKGTSEGEVVVIRKLTERDKEKLITLKTEASDTLPKCREKIAKHTLEMDLLDADISYDGKKLTFYFSASNRVDFRSLVPDLASTFKKLIRLQQVGMRDKAKCMTSVGRCGRETCCRQFLKGDLDTITVDMAYDQNLGQTSSNRVTGVCGKLMCCFKFEHDQYKKSKKKMPSLGSKIKTLEGEGIVISQNIIKNKIRVELFADKRIVEADC